MVAVSILARGSVGYALSAREAVLSVLQHTSFDVYLTCDSRANAAISADPRLHIFAMDSNSPIHRAEPFLSKFSALKNCLAACDDELIIQLDADAVIVRPLREAAAQEALGAFDLAMVEQTTISGSSMRRVEFLRHYVDHSLHFIAPGVKPPGIDDFRFYNSGVVLFRRAGLQRFLSWANEILDTRPADHRVGDHMIADQDYLQVWTNNVAVGAGRELPWFWNHCNHWDNDFPNPEALITHLSNFCNGPSLETALQLHQYRKPAVTRHCRQRDDKQISFVVVTYNSEQWLDCCVEAAEPFGAVIVVDNASQDGSIEIAKRRNATVIANASNNGFAAAANAGAKAAETELVCFLNPDCLLTERVVAAAQSALMADPRQLIVPDYVEQSGQRVEGSQPGYTPLKIMADLLENHHPETTRWLRSLPWLDDRTWRWPLAACLFAHRETFSNLGGFDEAYFCYMEDVALGRKANAAGVPTIGLDETVVHLGRRGSEIAIGDRHRMIAEARMLFARRCYGQTFVRFLRAQHLMLDCTSYIRSKLRTMTTIALS